MDRHVVLLQGPSSFFFRDLGQSLRRRGAKVTRICFAPGDWLFWSRSSGRHVRCAVKSDDFPDWISDFIQSKSPSDLVMLGDGRFYHRKTIAALRNIADGPRLHVIEHGLVRPGWILVDPDGLGGSSRIAERFARSKDVPPPSPSQATGAGFLKYVLLDIGYHTAGMCLGWVWNPNYVAHAPISPYREYAGWLGKFLRRGRTRRQDAETLKQLAKRDQTSDMFLLPLQLESDFQIRDHGKGPSLQAHVERILASFSMNARPGSVIVIKRHPLDNGLKDWRAFLVSVAARLGIADRVLYFDKADLDALLAETAGVVTVNSTVGLQAILSGVPCFTSGTAVYDLPGLTTSLPLDQFWCNPTLPDPAKARRFRDFLLTQNHVPGSFDGPGARIGANALAERILA